MSELPEPVEKKQGHFLISWVWLIPLAALLVASWMAWNYYHSRGPLVSIHFNEVSGIEAGRTQIYYRGVKVGTVESVELRRDLSGVDLQVRLLAFAKNLARDGSQFWLVKPTIGLGTMEGLETIITGNYIAVRAGQGPPKYKFEGDLQMPVTPMDDPGLSIRVIGKAAERIDRGAPVLYRGVQVGVVERKHLLEDGRVALDAYINAEDVDVVRKNARFWRIPAFTVKAGPGNLEIKIADVQSLLAGGLGFEAMPGTGEGQPAVDGDNFDLFPSQIAAEAVGTPFKLRVSNAQGLLEGHSLIRVQGIPVGLVTEVDPQPRQGTVIVTARLFSSALDILKSGSRFWVVRPEITLQGIEGLETILSGVYIDCLPGGGAAATSFTATDQPPYDSEWLRGSIEVKVLAEHTAVIPGAPVLYKGVSVGQVIKKGLAPDARRVELTLRIDSKYKPLVRKGSVFWNVTNVHAWIGFFSINFKAESVDSIALGGIAFATPEGTAMGAEAAPGDSYELHGQPRDEWVGWSPSLPLPAQ